MGRVAPCTPVVRFQNQTVGVSRSRGRSSWYSIHESTKRLRKCRTGIGNQWSINRDLIQIWILILQSRILIMIRWIYIRVWTFYLSITTPLREIKKLLCCSLRSNSRTMISWFWIVPLTRRLKWQAQDGYYYLSKCVMVPLLGYFCNMPTFGHGPCFPVLVVMKH